MSEPRSPADGPQAEPDETPVERAKDIYDEVGAENPDPITRREAIEGELDEEGLSDEGGELGEHNE
jgi:hypothetical protein